MARDKKEELRQQLGEFAKNQDFLRKGALAVALVITRQARNKGLPLDSKTLVTGGGGQVLGLGRSQVQTILRDHNITRVLAEEGGRTSRGSIGRMETYVEFLNLLHRNGIVDLETIEEWWVSRVSDHFAAKPMAFRLDPSKSLRTAIDDLLGQAEKRQKENPGATVVGTLLQHLVGAKIDLVTGGAIEHHPASASDEVTKRDADFVISNVAVHVTAAPGESLLRKCKHNIEKGLIPLIVTTRDGIGAAIVHAKQQDLFERVEILEIEQFLVGNIYERGVFVGGDQREAVAKLVAKYNEILEKCETEPGLRISVD